MRGFESRRRDRIERLRLRGGPEVSPRLVATWFLLASALLIARPQLAAAGWPLSAAARVTVPFGALYGTDGGGSRHHGADLEARSGDEVRAPLAGTVTFVGRVPAVGGGRVLAVSLQTSAGQVTLLPLAHADVTKGDAVGENGAVGTVATDGDGSSAATHLHVGLRVGDMYVDPLSAMSPPAAAGGSDGAGETAGAGAKAAAGAGAAVGSGVHAGASASGAGLPAGVSLAGSGAGAGSAANAPKTAGELAPGVSLAVRGTASGARVGAAGAAAAATVWGARAAHAVGRPVAHARPSAQAAPVHCDDARSRALDSVAAGLSALVSRARAGAVHGAKLGAYAALGLLGGMATLWPLWRGAGKGIRKVADSVAGEDVAAAPTR